MTADVMSLFSLSARPAFADVQLTAGAVAAAAGVAAAMQAVSAPGGDPLRVSCYPPSHALLTREFR